MSPTDIFYLSRIARNPRIFIYREGDKWLIHHLTLKNAREPTVFEPKVKKRRMVDEHCVKSVNKNWYKSVNDDFWRGYTHKTSRHQNYALNYTIEEAGR